MNKRPNRWHYWWKRPERPGECRTTWRDEQGEVSDVWIKDMVFDLPDSVQIAPIDEKTGRWTYMDRWRRDVD